MKNTFSFNRFGKLFAKELKEYYSKYGTAILCVLGIYFVYWLMNVIFNRGPIDVSERLDVLIVIFIVLIFAAPIKLYGECNNNKSGITYAMLPVSTLEKYLSMLFNCAIVTPLILFVCFFGLDAVLSFILPERGFAGTLFTSSVFTPTIMESFGSLILLQTGFFLGNLIFRRHKASQTILWIIALHIVLIIIMVLCFNIFDWENIFPNSSTETSGHLIVNGKTIIGNYDIENLSIMVKVFLRTYQFGLPLAFLTASYFKLKNIKY